MASWDRERTIVSSCTPSTWLPVSSEFKLVQLMCGSHEYVSVCNKINSTLDVEVQSVVRVQNPYLWGCYQLKKLEYKARGIYVKEVELFHCTAKSNVNSIAANNLDWRKCSRSKFGKGVSFSPFAEYANKYANFKIGSDRALILATVLVGREIYGNKDMVIPPRFIDTSFGNRNRKGTMVYVKYNDYEFYPLYVAFYTCNSVPHPRAGNNLFSNETDDPHHNIVLNDNSISRPMISRPISRPMISNPVQRSYQYRYEDESSTNSVSRSIPRISNPVNTSSISYQNRNIIKRDHESDWSCVVL